VRTRCLSFHATYRCRHSGECCRTEWDIEVDPHVVEAVQARRVIPVFSTPLAFADGRAGGAATVARTAAGECGFHNQHRCSLQAAGSEAMQPSACRHFPRVFLRDARGTLLTLSHFCPTAAALLFTESPVSVVDAVPPLALSEPVEGLDARDALPPLVRPGLLADMEGYAAWEDAVVRSLLGPDGTDKALATIDDATEVVRRWTPAEGPMVKAVDRAFAPALAAAQPMKLSSAFEIVTELTGPHPSMAVPLGFQPEWQRLQREAADLLGQIVPRYLAAAAFGNWIAYRGQGLRSIAGWLRASYDVLRVQLVRHLPAGGEAATRAQVIEAIRMADYIMVHTVDSLAFGRAAASLER